ncbi:MAG: carbohydrate kinase family protein [Desulfobacterales bacterium]|nr:carbohydrate kinase family protein [Desulfobacterales bacterium]
MKNPATHQKPSSTLSGGSPFRVLGMGTACMDYLVSVHDFPEENSQVYTETFEVQGGGNCGNTLVALSRLGIEAAIVTRIGTDAVGRQIHHSLKSEGVDTGFVIETDDRSPMSFIVVNDRNDTRTVIHRKGVGYGLPMDVHPSWLDNVDLLYLGGRFDAETVVAAEAKKRGIEIVVEAEHANTFADQLFAHADVVITAQAYHHQHFGNDHYVKNLERIIAMGPGIAVVTCGEKGAVLVSDDGVIEMKAFDISAVDTTGAGDAFAAGFIYGCLHRWPLENRLWFAQRMAAHQCTFFGARKGLAKQNDANAWLAETSLSS